MKDQIITKKILNWYDLNKRSLPWRKNVSQSKKHYYTLVSEFMLQQTQVVTVIPYFDRFINKIPNLKKLSKKFERLKSKYCCVLFLAVRLLSNFISNSELRRVEV